MFVNTPKDNHMQRGSRSRYIGMEERVRFTSAEYEASLGRKPILVFIPFWEWQIISGKHTEDEDIPLTPYGEMVIPSSVDALGKLLMVGYGGKKYLDFEKGGEVPLSTPILSITSNFPYVSRDFHFVYNTKLQILEPASPVIVTHPHDSSKRITVVVEREVTRPSDGSECKKHYKEFVTPFEIQRRHKEQGGTPPPPPRLCHPNPNNNNNNNRYHGIFHPKDYLARCVDIHHKSDGISVLTYAENQEYGQMMDIIATIYELSIPLSHIISRASLAISDTIDIIKTINKTQDTTVNIHAQKQEQVEIEINALFVFLTHFVKEYEYLSKKYSEDFIRNFKDILSEY
jgi:hypothetical protein